MRLPEQTGLDTEPAFFQIQASLVQKSLCRDTTRDLKIDLIQNMIKAQNHKRA